jgi:flagellar basal-body rod modification protein FlgD
MQITNTISSNTEIYDKSKLDVDNNKGEMDQTDFLKLFITQLKNQDPTSPMDDTAMMQQTATFSQVELLTSIEENIGKLVEGNDTVNTQQMMAYSSSYIGKLVEYEGNNTYMSDGIAAVSFKTDEVPLKTTVVIRDQEGNFVRSFTPKVTDTDMNTFYWDGTDADGNLMEEGKYKFSVVATGLDGEEVDVTTYGNGLVTGVKTIDGSVVYEVDGSDVAADKITSIRDAALLGG